MSDTAARLFAATLHANEQLTPIARKALDQYLADSEGVIESTVGYVGVPDVLTTRLRLHAFLFELVERVVRDVAADPTRTDAHAEIQQMAEAVLTLGVIVWNEARSKAESTDAPVSE